MPEGCQCDATLLQHWPLPTEPWTKRVKRALDTSEDLALAGVHAWDAGKDGDAVVLFRLALERNLSDVVALLGARYLFRGSPGLLPLPQERDLDSDLLCCAQRTDASCKTEAEQRLQLHPKNTACLFLLGTLRDVVCGSVDDGLPLYQAAAKGGFAAAKFNLGRCYFDGEGLEKDVDRAVKLFQATIKTRHPYPPGLCMLGLCYEQGQGLPCDHSKAVKMYARAGSYGLAMAECNLAWCYSNGRGVLKDFRKAARLYQTAAQKGLARAQCNLGFAYGYGEGFDPNLQLAVFWNRRASQQGNPAALYYLAWCYENGRPFGKDKSEAVRLYRLAADQGVEEARTILARLCPSVAAQRTADEPARQQ